MALSENYIKERNKMRKERKKRQEERRRQFALYNKKRQEGDEKALFIVIITRNRQIIKKVGESIWKKEAYNIFNSLTLENRMKVRFPIQYERPSTPKSFAPSLIHEILIVKTEQNGLHPSTRLRSATSGKMLENEVDGHPEYAIIAKKEWYMEESFPVYGYDNIRSKRDYLFIQDNLVLNNKNDNFGVRQFFLYANNFIVKYVNDFDIVCCKTVADAIRLYNEIEKIVKKRKLKYVFPMGVLSKELQKDFSKQMNEKVNFCLNNKRGNNQTEKSATEDSI